MSDTAVDVDLELVRLDGVTRFLVCLDGDKLDDTYLTTADGQIAWTTSAQSAASLSRAAGHGPERVDDWDGYTVDLALDLDGLMASVRMPMNPATEDRVLDAWSLFDTIAATVGMPRIQNAHLEAHLLNASGGGSILGRLWRKSKSTQADVEQMRTVISQGLQLTQAHLAPTPTPG